MLKIFLSLFIFLPLLALGQDNNIRSRGIIAGNVVDGDKNTPLAGASVQLLAEGKQLVSVLTDENGSFTIEQVEPGILSLSVSMTGYATIRVDSIHFRSDRMDFNLSDLKMQRSVSELTVVTVYAEKPLYENKDGKITFNASESALSNSATTTELLKQTPMVNVDDDGKLLLRGKEVKVLIDDKPVDMDSRQLQDLLESMPGSMIEKIEVLTTPPPQYANERGGVINIVTKKGKVGITGRLNVNYGTRGEAGINASGAYRKKGLAINVSAGVSSNRYNGTNTSSRQNIYQDSTNFFNTVASSSSKNIRPVSRLAIDYDLNKRNALSLALQLNAGDNNNASTTSYTNINRFDDPFRLSVRNVATGADNKNASLSASYTLKGKSPTTVFRVNTSYNRSQNDNSRDFYQQYLNPVNQTAFADSFQQQLTGVNNRLLNVRINYDRSIKPKKLSLSTGAHYQLQRSHNALSTLFLQRTDNIYVENPLLSNDFNFYQKVSGIRAALRYEIKQDFYINAGWLEEFTETDFDLVKQNGDYKNQYNSSLPFATIVKKWKNGFNITGSYKRTVQRPGINQMNPSVDYSDPYNLRFGNPFLRPYYASNYDLIFGYWNKKYNLNLSLGHNVLTDIYSSIRLLQPDAKTNITWQNINGRKEYEVHLWAGLNMIKKLKLNTSVSYVYNEYKVTDIKVNRFRNGGTFNSSLNSNYQITPLLNSTASFTYNRFANPQGTTRTALSMNVGVQQKLFQKNLTLSVNVVDPFRNQQSSYVLYGNGYILESNSSTRSRNVRIAAAYTFKKKQKPVKKKKPTKA